MRGGKVPWRAPGALAALAGLLLACSLLGALSVAAQDVTEAAAGAPAVQGHHHHHHHHRKRRAEPEEVTCEDVSDLDPHSDDRCAFVRAHCKSESLIDYPRLYYCHVARHKWLTYTMLLLCTCLLALLFRVIARASDDFFSCILSQISQDLGLPPRLGGVTLLALGNGAPDLSASIAAVKTGNYELALGALTGAGMFVGCVVAGRIVTLSGGAKARGAQIRDVLTQFITVVTVLGIIATGYFSYGSVATLLSIYAAYVVVVAVADFTHRAGVEWGELASRVSRRWSQKWRMELVSPLLQSDYASGAAGGLAGGSPVGQPLLEWTGSAPAAQPLDRPNSSPMPTPGQPVLPASSDWIAPAASVPHALDGRLAGVPDERDRVPSSPAAPIRRGIIGSLPNLLGGLRHEPQHLEHLQRHHPRHTPPVAAFQPRLPYTDLVHMPAREYRQRALAEMAQSKSFYRPARESELSDVDEESSSYDSATTSTPARPRSPACAGCLCAPAMMATISAWSTACWRTVSSASCWCRWAWLWTAGRW
jgi:sodium/potassium/calcium exchanger 6